MNKPVDADVLATRGRLYLLVDGAAVALVGPVSGSGMVFVTLGSVEVRPLPLHIATAFPGSEHGGASPTSLA